MSTGIKSAGVDLDLIFDPYVTGTSPGLTGFKTAGVDIHTRYAPIIYGTTAPVTYLKCKVGGAGSFVDLNTLFAKYGTAAYPIAINGQNYSHLYVVPNPGSGSSEIGFKLTGGTTWSVFSVDPDGTVTIATGSIPATSYRVQYTWGTYTIPVGDLDGGGAVTNGASTPQLVSTNPSTNYTTLVIGPAGASRGRKYPFIVDFFNSAGRNISHSVCTMTAEVDGSI